MVHEEVTCCAGVKPCMLVGNRTSNIALSSCSMLVHLSVDDSCNKAASSAFLRL